MACARVSLSHLLLLRPSFPSSLLHSFRSLPVIPTRKFTVFASLSAMNSSYSLADAASPKIDRWKPMCLYYTQGKCNKRVFMMGGKELNIEYDQVSLLIDIPKKGEPFY